MANTTKFNEELERILKKVPFSSNAKRDTCQKNLQFFYFKAVNKPAATPEDKDANLAQFVNQMETLVNKLMQDKIVLKNWGEHIKKEIIGLLNGDEPSTELPKVEPVKPVQQNNPNPGKVTTAPKVKVTIKPAENKGAKPKVQPKPDFDFSKVEHVDLSQVEELKPRMGESQEAFQTRMDTMVNEVFSDPSKYVQVNPVTVEMPKEEPKNEQSQQDNLSGKVVETEKPVSNNVQEKVDGDDATVQESQTEPEREEVTPEEVPVNQETFQEESQNQSEQNGEDSETESDSEGGDNPDDGVRFDHLDEEDSTQKEPETTEPPKNKKGGGEVWKVAAIFAGAALIGGTIGFAAGKVYSDKKSPTASNTHGIDAFLRK